MRIETRTQLSHLLLAFAALAVRGAAHQRNAPEARAYNLRRARTFEWAAEDVRNLAFADVADAARYFRKLAALYPADGNPYLGLSKTECTACRETWEEAARLVEDHVRPTQAQHVYLAPYPETVPTV